MVLNEKTALRFPVWEHVFKQLRKRLGTYPCNFLLKTAFYLSFTLLVFGKQMDSFSNQHIKRPTSKPPVCAFTLHEPPIA
jgi:hypothetical protein